MATNNVAEKVMFLRKKLAPNHNVSTKIIIELSLSTWHIFVIFFLTNVSSKRVFDGHKQCGGKSYVFAQKVSTHHDVSTKITLTRDSFKKKGHQYPQYKTTNINENELEKKCCIYYFVVFLF